MAEVLFYFFAGSIVFFSLGVITLKNPVYSVLLLIVTFFASSGVFILLGAEFLAMLLVIVYVGAVMVLFLFVVMMLDINISRLKKGLVKHVAIGVFLSLIIFAQVYYVITNSKNTSDENQIKSTVQITSNETNTKALGMVLYTNYALPFQISGLILLVAMIGAISLTLRTKVGLKRQRVSNQLLRNSKESVVLVKVKSGAGVE
jgi:NADH-quinone oxidoreductase subunit J